MSKAEYHVMEILNLKSFHDTLGDSPINAGWVRNVEGSSRWLSQVWVGDTNSSALQFGLNDLLSLDDLTTLNVGNTVIIIEQDKLWSGKSFSDYKLFATNVVLEMAFITWLENMYQSNCTVLDSFKFGNKEFVPMRRDNGLVITLHYCDTLGDILVIPYGTEITEATEKVMDHFKKEIFIRENELFNEDSLDVYLGINKSPTPTVLRKKDNRYVKMA